MTTKTDWISPAALTRLIIMSYFVAVALGLIGGKGILEFLRPILPASIGQPLMQALVLTLSMLILTGIARRQACLILSICVFFSSYTCLYVDGDISQFWRHLALVGALLMTANFNAPGEGNNGWVESGNDGDERKRTSRDYDSPVTPLSHQPFRDDLDMARSN